MTKKNLVFILPNFSFGGAGKSLLNICKNLNKKKYEIYALSLNKNYYKKELSNYCKEVVEIKSPSTLFSLKKINKYLSDFDKNNTIIIDKEGEGSINGFNEKFINEISNYTSLPILVFGGIVNKKQISRLLSKKQISGILIGNSLNYKEHSIKKIKNSIDSKQIRAHKVIGYK